MFSREKAIMEEQLHDPNVTITRLGLAAVIPAQRCKGKYVYNEYKNREYQQRNMN